ncbi:unnamed protein product [Caenorhabditis auriculariae]|uniref:SWIM-type domain-containing protein n=1 Tax=Caenorhabditis auriculariae TaxID=2777116 RepID=A0A8S1HYD6_9PELO|nr:unnamed protein product [Caenorhabditis auriculariae]
MSDKNFFLVCETDPMISGNTDMDTRLGTSFDMINLEEDEPGFEDKFNNNTKSAEKNCFEMAIQEENMNFPYMNISFFNYKSISKSYIIGKTTPPSYEIDIPLLAESVLNPNLHLSFYVQHNDKTTKDLTTDLYGKWSSQGQSSHSKSFYVNEELTNGSKENFVYRIKKYYSTNQSCVPEKSLKRVIWSAFNQHGDPIGFSLISYQTTPDFQGINKECHGNSLSTSNHSYQRVFPSSLREVDQKRQEKAPRKIISDSSNKLLGSGDQRIALRPTQVYDRAKIGGKKYGSTAKSYTDFDLLERFRAENPKFVRLVQDGGEHLQIMCASDSQLLMLAQNALDKKIVVDGLQKTRLAALGLTEDELHANFEIIPKVEKSHLEFDMSFSFGRFYISLLVTRHQKVVSNRPPHFGVPIICAFFVSSKKDSITYKWIADSLNGELMKLGFDGLKAYSLLTDSEKGLEVMLQHGIFAEPTVHLVCELHSRRNIEDMARRNGIHDELLHEILFRVFGSEIQQKIGRLKSLGILDSLTREKFLLKRDHLLQFLKNQGCTEEFMRYLQQKVAGLIGIGRATTNLVENSHRLMFNDLKEERTKGLESLLPALKRIVDENLSNIAASIVGSGTKYTLSPSYRATLSVPAAEWKKMPESDKEKMLKHVGVFQRELPETSSRCTTLELSFGRFTLVRYTSTWLSQIENEAKKMFEKVVPLPDGKLFACQDVLHGYVIASCEPICCNCPPYVKKGFCAHVLSIAMAQKSTDQLVQKIEYESARFKTTKQVIDRTSSCGQKDGKRARRLGNVATARVCNRTIHNIQNALPLPGKLMDLPPFEVIDKTACKTNFTMPYHNSLKFEFVLNDGRKRRPKKCASCQVDFVLSAPQNLILCHQERVLFEKNGADHWTKNTQARYCHARTSCLLRRYPYLGAGGNVFCIDSAIVPLITEEHRQMVFENLTFILPN